jgi:hypothetical protein
VERTGKSREESTGDPMTPETELTKLRAQVAVLKREVKAVREYEENEQRDRAVISPREMQSIKRARQRIQLAINKARAATDESGAMREASDGSN